MFYDIPCRQCPDLCRSRSRIVWGHHATYGRNFTPGPDTCSVMYIGEAPGFGEDRSGIPFDPYAMTGREVRKLLWRVGVDEHTYITNVVKCHPKDDRDPTPDEIANCRVWLMKEIYRCHPRLIVTAGRFAAYAILGRDDFTMEMVSGTLYNSPIGIPTLPMTHPAAGFRRQRDLTAVMDAFKLIRPALDGEIKPRDLPCAPSAGDLDYRRSNPHELYRYLANGPDVLAMDTEEGHGGTTWCTTISNRPGTARMVMGDDQESCAAVQSYITNVNPLVIIHSALYDIPELRRIGITPRRIFDTMVAAYMLQDEPLGLKALAWRHNNVKMDSYTDTIMPARRQNALDYLHRVCSHPQSWPDPEPTLVYEKGVPRIKKPQNILKKAKRIIGDVEKGKVNKDGTLVCPRKRWFNIKPEDGRSMVEDRIGDMPDGFLQDIPIAHSIGYACADADQTLRIFPYLQERIGTEGLYEPFSDEMGCIWFIDDMHEFGIPCDRQYYLSLSDQYQEDMAQVEQKITSAAGGIITQLSSSQQVSKLLYDPDKLDLSRYIPKKLSKKAGATKTGDDIMAQLLIGLAADGSKESAAYSIIEWIRDHRELQKLDGTYARGVPKHIAADGRSHPNFRTTTTETSRLSCADPNWMAMPKRSERAKDIRNGAQVLDGCAILSTDYSQIELRLTAEEANEQSMIDAFKRGLDLHSLTAYEMFFGRPDWSTMDDDKIKTELARVNKQTQRLPAKTINFGIIYGISADGLYRNMIVVPGCEHWTKSLAQEYIDNYFSIRPGIRDYIADTNAMATKHGKVWDWAGRIRRIPGAALVNEYKRAEALRQACNARIQTGAQSIIKRAMVQLKPLYDGFRAMGYTCSPMIQIHDDIVSMVSLDVLPILVPAQKAIMEQVKPLKAGVRVDVEYSLTGWGDLVKYEI